jgi:hypothetical protein
MLEKVAGICLGVVTLLALGIVGVVRFIPDAGRYLRIKRM